MTHDEAEDFLAHYGKLGMKWGRRSAGTPTSGKTIAGQIATGGLYLGNKARYKTPEAQRLRKSAGRMRAVSLGIAGANIAQLSIRQMMGSPNINLGSDIVSRLLKGATDAAAVASTVQGVRAVRANKP